MSITSVPAASFAHAALFAEASAHSHGNLAKVAIDDCGTVVPHKFPGGNPPPPPPPFLLAHFAGVSMPAAFSGDEPPGCGNEPHKFPLNFPFPPPPPLPGVDVARQLLNV